MKTKHFLILAIAGLSLLSGCSREHKVAPSCWMQKSSEISANGGTCTVGVSSNVAWTATIDAAATWCSIISGSVFTPNPQEDPDVEQGNTITLAVPMLPYTVTEGRSTTLTITGDGISKTSIITQVPGIRVHDVIVARTNVDELGTFADSPGDFGKLYQFNRTTAYDQFEPVNGIPLNWPATYAYEDCDWLPENDPCPPGWEVPSLSFFTQHVYLSGSIFKMIPLNNGFPFPGLLCGDSIATATYDDMKSCYFLPAISGRDKNGEPDGHNIATKGFYWLKNVWGFNGNVTLGEIIEFDILGEVGFSRDMKNKACALPVRCIKK